MMSSEECDDGSAEDLQSEQSETKRPDSSTVSHQSVNRGRSITPPLDLIARGDTKRTELKTPDSSTASQMSMKSGRSITPPLDFKTEEQGDTERNVVEEHAKIVDNIHICSICVEEEHQGHSKIYTAKPYVPDSQSMLLCIMENMKSEDFKTFKSELSEEYRGCLGHQSEELSVSETAEKIMESFGGETALRILFHFQTNDDNKTNLKSRCQQINEGNSYQGKQSLLTEIYTDLYLADGGSREINNEHEVLRNEMISQSRTQEVLYSCNEIFKTRPGQRTQVRTVLTMGIAGIGKHVSVQKFILDWADGEENQDIEVIIHLPFRYLNHREESCSLQQLVLQYAPELKDAILHNLKVLFILDGLGLCQYPLDFHRNVHCSDINEKVAVDVLLTNLIKGNLLPSALLWITTRPSTASLIPPECVHRVTEIRGFSDHQKEAYFRRKIRDQKLAGDIIAHMKSCQSLYIMCHLPIFCWISATVLENTMRNGNSEEKPRTLTGMFTHFLLIQISLKHKKFNGADVDDPRKLSESDKTFILRLGELAFRKMEDSLIFKEEDLRKGGVDVSKASEYSMCTEIFREELGLYRQKLYSFVHLSYQEYLAAIYAHFACVNDGINVLVKEESKNSSDLSDVHQTAVDEALKSENGHLDLFLRFLLGLSVDCNCDLLRDLLKHSSCKSCADRSRTVNFIKEKIKQEQSPERIINLFHCLNELNDNTLAKQIKAAMKSGTLQGNELEPEQWSALAYVYLISQEMLDEFDMIKFKTSTANQLRLLPVLRICKKARLDCCNLSAASCRVVASALKLVNSPLTELDLSNCKLNQRGVNVLLDGLKSPHCKVEKLRLAGCFFPSASCANFASILNSTNSQLFELDLSYNKITSSGVKKLCDGLVSQNCKLQKLILTRCGITEVSCAHLAIFLKSNSHLKKLELKGNDLQDSGVKLLSTGLQDPQCRLQTLGLSACMITKEGCISLVSALGSNADHLKELDLSYNHPGDSGMKLLCAKKEDPNCKLEKLHFNKGGERRMKPGLMKYARQLTVDPNTVHLRLKLSDEGRKILETTVPQKYPDHPDRYTLYPQAMCLEELTDRCYFEVTYTGGVGVGVGYKTADRSINLIGLNNTFPSLFCQDGKLKLWQHNEITQAFPGFTQSNRVGLYVDRKQGCLSYYSIRNGTAIHLNTHHTDFSEGLYIGFIFMPDSSVTLCEMA